MKSYNLWNEQTENHIKWSNLNRERQKLDSLVIPLYTQKYKSNC